ncbi:Bacterial SH3 domain protein [Fructobacillus sp. EFB-N1]|nr:Bacterial SH3 domain protein [Fructobacillus sp. EFB-N1]
MTDSVKTPDNSTQKEGADGVDTTVIDLKKLLMGGIDNRSNLFSVNLVQSTAYYSQEQVNNAIAIHSFLSSKGWTDNAIAGLLGNIVSESAIIPDKWEVGGGGGYGLVQWTPANKLIQWCNSQGMDWHTINAQCARINYELQNGIQFYPSRAYGINGKSYISSSLSPYTMGLIFLANYERPYDSNQPNRGNQAQYWYDYFNGDNESQASQGTQESGTYTFSQATNIRTSPSLSGQIVGRYSAGDSVSYNSKVQADGYTWLQYTTASGRSCYVAVLDSGSASQTSQGTQESGTYTFSQATNIRTSPSLSGQIVGRYSAGDSVSYNSKVQADGYTWLQYTTASGRSCYVAVL